MCIYCIGIDNFKYELNFLYLFYYISRELRDKRGGFSVKCKSMNRQTSLFPLPPPKRNCVVSMYF